MSTPEIDALKGIQSALYFIAFAIIAAAFLINSNRK